MAARPTITIITPCRNSAPTLRLALQSVRDQNYPGLEHLVIDGASTDGTFDILKSTPGIRYMSEPDRGLSDALNKGLRLATGDVIGWLNADDYYLPGTLERVGEAFADPEVLWCTGPCLIVDVNGAEIRRQVTAYKNFLLRHYSLGLLLTQNFVSAPSTFVRRSAFETVGVFDEKWRYSMDYDIWLRLARLRPPAILHAPVAAFRMAEGSLSMTGFEQQFVEHRDVAQAHRDGHRAAAAVNVATSRVIVAVYKMLARVRRAKRPAA